MEYGNDTNVISRFFLRYGGSAPTSAQLVTMASALNTAWGTNLKPLCQAQAALRRHDIEDLSSSTGAVGSSASLQGGTRAGVQLPGSTSLVAAYQIARRYRGGHPRGYWPFGAEADLNSPQDWTAAFLTAAQSGLQAYFTAASAAGWTGAGTIDHVNVSYYNGFTVVTNPITGRARNVPKLRTVPVIDAVTNVVARNILGTQRRRAL
jgi:hypothetical protein